MFPLAELLPFVFLGIVVGIFIPMGNNSTNRGGVRPLSVPYTGDSLRTQPYVVGFMANFLNIIHLVAALRGATTIGRFDLTTTSLSPLTIITGSTAAAPTRPYDILWSNAQAIGWAGLARVSFDVLSDVEDSLQAQPFEPTYVQYYITSFILTILSYPNAITPDTRANIADYLVYNDITLFNEEYLFFAFGNNLIVADFIITAGHHVSPIVIGLLHLAWSDPGVAQTLRRFSYGPPSWGRYTRHLSGSSSIQQITHSVHCQTPVWPFNIPFELSDGEVEYMAALLALAVFVFHDDSFSLMK